jgi:hypothetical protein
MSFDPNLPADGTEMVSSEMRSQLTGLKSLIDAIPPVTNAMVDSTSTLSPGDPASAAVVLNAGALHFTFGIPVGPVGPMGPQGDPGPPFAAAQVDITNTSPPGSSAAVSVWFDGVNVHFNFDIPQGMPGEVSAATLTNEINNLLSNSSNSSNGVALLLPAQPNPTLMEVAQKLDELIQALRR